ncbi:hypothetical protein RHGRI_013441 [Rhododendron griersonianum]|uniref:F-box/LRR-repeat protein 15/At3g58940/PEG3-like LRR domain-containing protein n=1 Tax=Rhododendron griersonianum TaxID=479676 RepID=A0AAV6K5U0_9ERIC|nr:hypothetical protein RHGRI_013441 [Rhododendron griersonianum]
MFNIDSSPHLKDLMLMGLGMTDRFFHDLIARFPLLEKLELRFCREIRRINISSRILKSFVLRHCLKLVEAKIDAPNLLSVKYDIMPSLSITTTTSPQKWEPIDNFRGGITGLSSFIRLREFIMSFNQSVTLGFNVFDWPEKKRLKRVDLKRMPPIDQVPVIEHLKLRVFSDLRLCCESLVDSLFWSCHPRKLSLVSIKLNKTLIEKLCEMLMEREDDPCCCSSSNSKCWRHYLKNVEIGTFELKNKVERPLHLKTSSDLFPFLGEHQGVYFKLKWSTYDDVVTLDRSTYDDVNIEEVEIRAAPNLQSFNYVVTNGLPWMFNIDSSPHLKNLMLMGLGMTDRFFHDLIARFPLLEKLELRFCHEIRRINISSRILKSFVLRYCLKLVEAKIDAPNLLSVKYDIMPSLSITTTTSPQKWEPIYNFRGGITGLSSFIWLREFIMSFNQSVTLGFNVFDWPEKKRLKRVDLKRMPPIDQVPVIEHLKLRVFSDLRLCCESLVDSLFWSCHPRKLSLVSIKLNKTLIEKLCEMLMEREDDPCCCSSSNSKCWRHYLKNVEIGTFELKNKVERPHHLKSSSDLFPSLGEHQGVYFKLKW